MLFVIFWSLTNSLISFIVEDSSMNILPNISFFVLHEKENKGWIFFYIILLICSHKIKQLYSSNFTKFLTINMSFKVGNQVPTKQTINAKVWSSVPLDYTYGGNCLTTSTVIILYVPHRACCTTSISSAQPLSKLYIHLRTHRRAWRHISYNALETHWIECNTFVLDH